MLVHSVVMVVDGVTDDASYSDVILIFGNKVYIDGSLSKRLQSRLDKGIQLYNQRIAPTIIVSGGLGKEGHQESAVMKEYLLLHGIPKSAIIEDKNGYNTYQTAKNVKAVIENTTAKIVIVTQYYHITRAKLALKKFGFKNVHAAHADMFPELRDLYSIPREVVGYYYYFFRNYL